MSAETGIFLALCTTTAVLVYLSFKFASHPSKAFQMMGLFFFGAGLAFVNLLVFAAFEAAAASGTMPYLTGSVASAMITIITWLLIGSAFMFIGRAIIFFFLAVWEWFATFGNSRRKNKEKEGFGEWDFGA